MKPYETTYVCEECGKVHYMTFGCGSRFDSVCPSCAQKWRDDTAKAFAGALYWFKNPKMLTLTIRKDMNHPYDLVAVEQQVWKKFHQFRRIMKDVYHVNIIRFEGVLELPNHVHVFIDCKYIPFKTIQKVWKELTFGQSWHVNIRAINMDGRSARNVVKYVTKYVTKTKYSVDGKSLIFNLEELRGFRLKQSWKCPKAPHPIMCHLGSVRIATHLEECFRHFDDLEGWKLKNRERHVSADNG